MPGQTSRDHRRKLTLHTTARICEGLILLFSGNVETGRVDDTLLYDSSDDSWSLLSPASAPSARLNHAMSYLGGDQVLLFGGWDGTRNGETWIYPIVVPEELFNDGFEYPDN